MVLGLLSVCIQWGRENGEEENKSLVGFNSIPGFTAASSKLAIPSTQPKTQCFEKVLHGFASVGVKASLCFRSLL